MPEAEETFERALYETIEKALLEVLGEKVTSALRFYVDLKSAMKHPDRFMGVMFDIVGPRAADSLREKVLQELYKRFGLVYQKSGAKLSDEIAALRSQLTH